MKLVVGLGNPGGKYLETRHNVGWMVLDRLADRAGWSGRGKERDAAATSRGRIDDVDVMLAKPLTFMNDSGIAVRKILAREHVPLPEVLVVADDFALPFGRMRIRPSGTHGGHNGLRSIMVELETQDFARLRVGIGEPDRHAIDHVLSRFSAPERKLLPDLIDAAADAVLTWARDGTATAMNRWNGWVLEGTAPKPAPATDAGRAGDRSGDARAARDGGADGPAGGPDTDGEGPRNGGDPDAAEPAPGAIDGPPGPDGVRRTRTGWRRVLGRDAGER